MYLVVVDNDPVHTDFVNVPLTLRCGTQAVDGIRLQYQVDNVAPAFSCDGFSHIRPMMAQIPSQVR